MAHDSNEATFRFELPVDLDGVPLSERIAQTTLQHASAAGAVSIGDVHVIGSLDLGTGMRQYSVRVRLYFGGLA